MTGYRFKIGGMTCNHCANSIQDTLAQIKGVTANVSFEMKLAEIKAPDNVSRNVLADTINEAGFSVIDDIQEDCYSKDTTQNNDYNNLHLVIIGSGSGAFAAAIKAADGGARVTIIEGAEVIGGCCVNVGCVPSKIMIRSAHLAQHQRQNPFPGLQNHEPVIDRKRLVEQQQSRVDQLRLAKYESILESNSALTLIKGFAEFKDRKTLIVTKPNGSQTELTADRILITTGSKAFIPPIDGIEAVPYWTSAEALFAEKLPQHLVVVGSSVVAVELAQAYQRLGSK